LQLLKGSGQVQKTGFRGIIQHPDRSNHANLAAFRLSPTRSLIKDQGVGPQLFCE